MLYPLYTAGYTGISPADLLTVTQQLGALLVDIRLSPWSRNEDWHKPALEDRFGDLYSHLPALGNLNYKGDFGKDKIMLKDVERGTCEVAKLLAYQPVILLCMCKSHLTCHRNVAATEMQERYQVQVIHLTADQMYVMCHPKPDLPKQQLLF